MWTPLTQVRLGERYIVMWDIQADRAQYAAASSIPPTIYILSFIVYNTSARI